MVRARPDGPAVSSLTLRLVLITLYMQRVREELATAYGGGLITGQVKVGARHRSPRTAEGSRRSAGRAGRAQEQEGSRGVTVQSACNRSPP